MEVFPDVPALPSFMCVTLVDIPPAAFACVKLPLSPQIKETETSRRAATLLHTKDFDGFVRCFFANPSQTEFFVTEQIVAAVLRANVFGL